MIDVEERMSRPCLRIREAERIRQHLLLHIVDINNVTVQTREVILRVFNSNLSAIFRRLVSRRQELQVLICEKKNSLILDAELRVFDPFYVKVLGQFAEYGVNPRHVELISNGLVSNSAIMRVASRCAIVLMVAFIELDADNV
jgi:hypothetical protein